MKCKVLMGPIASGDRHYEDGETIDLSDDDAKMFASWGFVEVLPMSKADVKAAAAPVPVPVPVPTPVEASK